MSPEEFQDITYKKDGTGLVILTLNRPERKNSMSRLTFLELFYAVDALEKDDGAHVMIITGAVDIEYHDVKKEAFSSGGNFTRKALDNASDAVKAEMNFSDIAQRKLTMKMWSCDKPIIAAINGLAIGAGITMPLSGCDLIYASEHAWVQFPFVQLGILPEFSYTYLMPRLVGYQKANEIALFGEKITAQEALQLGFINKVLPHEELLDFAKERASKLMPPNGPGLAVRLTKTALHQPYIEAIAKSLELENDGLLKAMGSKDFVEFVRAKMEKRKPEFMGC